MTGRAKAASSKYPQCLSLEWGRSRRAQQSTEGSLHRLASQTAVFISSMSQVLEESCTKMNGESDYVLRPRNSSGVIEVLKLIFFFFFRPGGGGAHF